MSFISLSTSFWLISVYVDVFCLRSLWLPCYIKHMAEVYLLNIALLDFILIQKWTAYWGQLRLAWLFIIKPFHWTRRSASVSNHCLLASVSRLIWPPRTWSNHLMLGLHTWHDNLSTTIGLLLLQCRKYENLWLWYNIAHHCWFSS